jgi:hypothetical protein
VTPVPERETVLLPDRCLPLLPGAPMVETDNVPLAVPLDAGVNVTEMLALCAGGTVSELGPL